MTPFPAPPSCAPSTPKLPLTTVSDRGLCALSNPFGYSRRLVCSGMALTHPPSCLPSLGTTLLSVPLAGHSPLRYYGDSDSCSVHLPCRSPHLLRHTFLSFRLQPRRLPGHRFPPRQRVQRVSDFAMNEQARRSSPPNRVRYPTDQQFASGCSPPRLTATQLPSATEFVAYSDTDFHRADVAPSRAHDTRFRGYDGNLRFTSVFRVLHSL